MTKRNLLDGVKRGETTPENSPYHDGQGLYLQVDEGTDGERYRSWSFRYKLTDGSPWGTQKYKGLGSIEVISLAAARKLLKELRMAQALAKVRNQPWDPVGESRKANAESKISRRRPKRRA